MDNEEEANVDIEKARQICSNYGYQHALYFLMMCTSKKEKKNKIKRSKSVNDIEKNKNRYFSRR
jgi:hypothetical protein